MSARRVYSLMLFVLALAVVVSAIITAPLSLDVDFDARVDNGVMWTRRDRCQFV